MAKLNLAENSRSYLENATVYEAFSAAQDKRDLIARFLRPKIQNKVVLDVGCGTGKFVTKLSRSSKKYIALDISEQQIQIAAQKNKDKKVKFICSTALDIPLKSGTADIAIATWVFGTIRGYARKKQALSEVLRVLKPGGKVYFVENDLGGEFESIRGRFPNTRRTAR